MTGSVLGEIIGYVHKTHTTFSIGGNTIWVQNSKLHKDINKHFASRIDWDDFRKWEKEAEKGRQEN